MNISKLLKKMTIAVAVCTWSFTVAAQNVSIDLSKLVLNQSVRAVNREVSMAEDGTKGSYIHLNEKHGAGVAWLEGVKFTNGTIEFDVKGRNVLQKSFVGIAFHGSNDSTYDAVYFRPFNFKSPEEERRNHSVQYISLPGFDWPKLRSEYPLKYEQPVNPSPEPEEWVHCSLVVENQEVRVYVNRNSKPSLVVKQLSNQKGDKVGFWVGNGSDGNFANINIK